MLQLSRNDRKVSYNRITYILGCECLGVIYKKRQNEVARSWCGIPVNATAAVRTSQTQARPGW